MKNYYCIIHQFGEMRMDWRPLNLGARTAVYSNKKRANKMLVFYSLQHPKKNLWLANIAIEILPVKVK